MKTSLVMNRRDCTGCALRRAWGMSCLPPCAPFGVQGGFASCALWRDWLGCALWLVPLLGCALWRDCPGRALRRTSVMAVFNAVTIANFLAGCCDLSAALCALLRAVGSFEVRPLIVSPSGFFERPRSPLRSS